MADRDDFADARNLMSWHLRHDDELLITYRANVAMLLHDRYGIADPATRNRAADDILELIFDLKHGHLERKQEERRHERR